MPIGFTFPFTKTSGSVGYFETTEDELEAVKQNIRSLIMTNWGERVMHYYFGANLIEFLFTNDRSGELRAKIADRILNQISTWMPFVIVDELNVIFPEDDPLIPEHVIRIDMSFRLSNRPERSSFLSVDSSSVS